MIITLLNYLILLLLALFVVCMFIGAWKTLTKIGKQHPDFDEMDDFSQIGKLFRSKK